MNMVDMVWHDGILSELFFGTDGEVYIGCDLRISEGAEVREPIRIYCLGVSSLNCSFDFLALGENAKVGNITAGKIDSNGKKGVTLKMFFADGYLEVKAKSVRLEQCEEELEE